MFKSKYDSEFKDESNFIKKIVLSVILLGVVVGFAGWLFSRAEQAVDTGIVRYEEFQEIYNTCQKINTDLGIIKAIPDDDRNFANFSKASQLAAKKQQLARWVEEYNGKSKMINRSLWKSSSLPYQLKVEEFSNY